MWLHNEKQFKKYIAFFFHDTAHCIVLQDSSPKVLKLCALHLFVYRHILSLHFKFFNIWNSSCLPLLDNKASTSYTFLILLILSVYLCWKTQNLPKMFNFTSIIAVISRRIELTVGERSKSWAELDANVFYSVHTWSDLGDFFFPPCLLVSSHSEPFPVSVFFIWLRVIIMSSGPQ